MGCCSSRPKPEPSHFVEESNIESISQPLECLKFTFQAIRLTKSYEKIIKSPSEFYISLSTASEVHITPSVYIEGLHFSFELSPEIILKSPVSHLTLSLCIKKFSLSTPIGSVVIDMEIFKNYKQFKGSIPVMYRCIKTGTIHLEMYRYISDFDFMTLSEQSKCFVGNYLPSRDYPAQFASIFSPTPKFNTFQSSEPRMHSHNAAVEKVKILKGKQVDFEFLLESLEENSPEILYYVFEKLNFFACQSNYSSRIDMSRVLNILEKYSTDHFIVIKTLWLLYYLIESSDMVTYN